MNALRYLCLVPVLFKSILFKAQEPACSLNSFPLLLIADFQNLHDYEEIVLFETYIINNDTLFQNQVVRKYTYQKDKIRERYEKNIYTVKDSIQYCTEEVVDKNCFFNGYKSYKTGKVIKSNGTKTCRFKKGSSNYEDIIYFSNENKVAKKQKIITPLNDSVCKMIEKEWRHDTLIANKSSIIRAAVPDFTYSRNLPEEEAENFIFDNQNRPYQLIRATRKVSTSYDEIFKFVYNENALLPYKVDCFGAAYAGGKSAAPIAIITFEKYNGKIPTYVTYTKNDERLKANEKIIIEIQVKQSR